MIRYLYAADLEQHPTLAHEMFTHRAQQFKERLGWDVKVDTMGWETDEYDQLNPLYVIATTPEGHHAGSMRFLPSTGPNMLADHFAHLTEGVVIRAPLIWECTRLCAAPNAPHNNASLLLAGAAELGQRLRLTHALGVFDHRMPRVYQRLGWAPDVMGTKDKISAGIWSFAPDRRSALCEKAGITREELTRWFDHDLNALPAAAV